MRPGFFLDPHTQWRNLSR